MSDSSTPVSAALFDPAAIDSLTQQAAAAQQSRNQQSAGVFNGLVQQAAHWQAKRDLLSPEERKQFTKNPVGLSAQAEIRAAELARNGPLNDNEKFAIFDAFNRAAGHPSEIQNPNQYDQQMRQVSAQGNTFLENVGGTLGRSLAAPVLQTEAIIAPEDAYARQQQVEATYAPSEQGSGGDIVGGLIGAGVNAVPLIAAGGAAPLVMGAQGVGAARLEVAGQRANGNQIGTGQAAAYEALSGLINYAAGNVLSKLGGNGAVPFAKLIDQLPQALQDQIVGTGGKAIIPFIAQTLLKAGIGASDNEVANVAQNAAALLTRVDKNRKLLAGSENALVTGAALAGGLHAENALHEQGIEAGTPGYDESQPILHNIGGTLIEEPAEKPLIPPENEAAAPLPKPAPESTAKPPLTEGEDYFDEGNVASPDEHNAEVQTPEDEGRQLPFEAPLAKNPDFVALQERQQKDIAESDELLNGSSIDRLGGNGKLPNETDLTTGEPENPLVTKLRQIDPDARTAEAGKYQELFDDVAGGMEKKIIPITSDKVAGFADPAHPDTILVNAKNPKPGIWNAIAHEIAHTLQFEFPAMFKRMRDRLPAWFKKSAIDNYSDMLAKQGWPKDKIAEYVKQYGDEEINSIAFGESAVKSKMLQRQLGGKDDGVLNAVRTSVERVLNKFTSNGRIINEVSDALRESVGLSKAKAATVNVSSPDAFLAQGGRMSPRSRDYLALGHKFKQDGTEEVWWSNEGQLTTAPTNKGRATHAEYGADDADYRGRIDHAAKEISVLPAAENESDPMLAHHVKSVVKQLEKKYPGYEVFVATKGGLTPAEELTSGRLYPTLDTVAKLKDDEPIGEKAKDIYNKLTPENGWKYAHGVGDKWKRGFVDSLSDLVDFTRVIDAGKSVTQVPLEAYIRLHTGVVDRIGRMHKFGLRGLFGDAIVDPKDNKTPMNIEWRLGPVKDVVSQLPKGMSRRMKRRAAFDFTNFATDLGVAESTKERGENMVRAEQWKALKAKVKALMAELPAGKRPKSKTEAAGEDEEKAAKVKPTDAERVERTSALAEIETAKQALRLLMDEKKAAKNAGAQGTTDEAAKGKKAKAPGVSMLERAKRKLNAYQSLIMAEMTGEHVKPEDIFSKDELAKMRDRALSRPLTGIGKVGGKESNGHRDIAVAAEFIRNAEQDNNYLHAKEFLRRYRLYGNAHLGILLDSGRISREQASNIRKSNEFYTDLHRVMEKTGSLDIGQTAGSGVLHKFRGSNRDIDNPFVNQQLTTSRSYQAAERNWVVAEIIGQAQKDDPDAVRILGDKDKATSNTVTFYKEGKPVRADLDPHVAEAINGWGKYTTPAAVRAIGRVTGFAGRMLITLMQKNPAYHVNNIIKDMRDRAMLSTESGGIHTLKTEFRGFSDKSAQELVQVLGGTFGGHGELAVNRAAHERIFKSAMNDIVGDPNAILALPRKLWRGFDHFENMSETVGRTAEYTTQYDAALKRGMAPNDARYYAAWKARDLMDFAVSGSWVKALNEICYMPFLNSSIRGTAKHIELARNNPQQYVRRMALYGLLPAMMPAIFAYSQGKEQWERYKGISLVQRMLFDNYMIGNLRIAIPRGSMTAFTSLIPEIAHQNHLTPGDVFRAFAASALPPQAESPSNIIPLHGVLESSFNYSPFYNRTIIPPDEEGVALDLRNTSGASPLAKAISIMVQHAGMEVDPRKIEHVINTDFGSFGSLVDSASRLVGGRGVGAGTQAAMLGGVVRLNPGYTDQNIQNALNNAHRYRDDSNPQVTAIKGLLHQAGQAGTPADRQQFIDQARTIAQSANNFYDANADKLLEVKKIGMAATNAENAYKDAADKGQFIREHPDQLALIRRKAFYDRAMSRINELRKVQVNPKTSPATQTMATNEIQRLLNMMLGVK